LIDRERPAGVDLSPLLTFASWIDLAALRDGTVEAGIDGLILKRWDSPYVAGDTHENWLAWRRDPHVACAVLLYAQRGAGGRSAHFTDVTVGARQGSTFLPIGKAKLSLADDEQTRLDAWIDRHAVEKFGPVRSVDPKLVFEAAFDGVERSTRRRSGVALKSLRVRRILWDRSAEDAADLEAIRRLLPPG
jgi:DNA ligase-1